MSCDNVKVSILVCTHYNSSVLDRVLDRLAQQYCPEGSAWEVLVVDNNCTDETQQVVERHKNADRIRRLRVVSERRQGRTPARQRGVKETAGEWPAFIDDECLLAECWLVNAMRCGALGSLLGERG
jgi:glycosyltransferase involved in cell wall biosynthesis